MLIVSNYSPGHNKCALQPQIHFLAHHQRHILNVTRKLDMSLLPLLQKLHLRNLFKNTVRQTTNQHQPSDTHVLGQIITNRSLVNLHEKSKHVLEDDWRLLLQAPADNLFWSCCWFDHLLVQSLGIGEFLFEKSVHHWNCWAAEGSLETDVADVWDVQVRLEEFYVFDHFVVDVWNVSVSSFRTQPIHSLSVSERRCVKNRVSKSSSRPHNAQSQLLVHLVSIQRHKLLIWYQQ